MKRSLFLKTTAAAFLVGTFAAPAQDQSLKNEVNASIQKGVAFLKSKQLESGAWGDPATPGSQPAFTALAVMSLQADPGASKTELSEAAKKGVAFLLSVQKEDGGIYTEKPLATYNTSLALTALSTIPIDAKTREAAIKARRFVVGLQGKFNEKNEADPNSTFDSPHNGGIGYTSKTAYSDLSNTHFALEALYYSKNLFADSPDAEKNEPKLDFEAAIKFVSRCQNLKATNDQAWAAADKQDEGGFVYRPGESKVDPATTADGKVALRSYASMSYAGLLSFIYADLSPKDQRISAVKEWLGKNYSVKENPGMGAQGLYYYYHTMSKALSLSKIDKLPLDGGKTANWKLDLSNALFNAQQADGSWTNTAAARWMEKDPVLVTSYSVLALAHLKSSL